MVCPVRARFEKNRCYRRKLTNHYVLKQDGQQERPREATVSDKTITRLRWYLSALTGFLAQGVSRVSSQDIARKTGVTSWLVRRDLNRFGGFGRKSIGYDASFLRARLTEILHLGEPKTVVWIGSARLADDSTLAERFGEHNCRIVAVFDSDPKRIGVPIAGMAVQPQSALYEVTKQLGANAAVVSVPEPEAQAVADILVSAGVRAMLNLTSAVLVVPAGVLVRNVDVVAELSTLSYYCGEA